MATDAHNGQVETPSPEQHLSAAGRELTDLLKDADDETVRDTLATSVEAISAAVTSQPLSKLRRSLRESICHMLLQLDATLRELEAQLSPGDRRTVQQQRVRITTAAEALIEEGDRA